MDPNALKIQLETVQSEINLLIQKLSGLKDKLSALNSAFLQAQADRSSCKRTIGWNNSCLDANSARQTDLINQVNAVKNEISSTESALSSKKEIMAKLAADFKLALDKAQEIAKSLQDQIKGQPMQSAPQGGGPDQTQNALDTAAKATDKAAEIAAPTASKILGIQVTKEKKYLWYGVGIVAIIVVVLLVKKLI